MSNDLALLQDNVVELNRAFGYTGRPKPPIPVLKINGADEEPGKTPPKGTFVYALTRKHFSTVCSIIRTKTTTICLSCLMTSAKSFGLRLVD